MGLSPDLKAACYYYREFGRSRGLAQHRKGTHMQNRISHPQVGWPVMLIDRVWSAQKNIAVHHACQRCCVMPLPEGS